MKEVIKEEQMEGKLVAEEKEDVVQEETIEEKTEENTLRQSWPPLTQPMTLRSFEKTRLSALSVSHDKRLETVTEEQEMEQEQEITSVSSYMCTIIKVNYLR